MLSAARIFIPGWGATAGLYEAGIPDGWEVLELPTFRDTDGMIDVYRQYVRDELERRDAPLTLAGHSMGGALAVLAAADQPERIRELILIAPAGLPLTKPLLASTMTFISQVMRRCYPAHELYLAVANTAGAPRAALRLARQSHDLDLTPEFGRVRTGGIQCRVVGCSEDGLATPEHCRRVATLLNAEYREIHARDGHIWPITNAERLKVELAA